MLYYGAQVWLGERTPKSHLKKLTSLHYRLLSIVKNDWRNKISRNELEKLGK